MAWNQPGRKPAPRPSQSGGQPPRGSRPDGTPPGLDEALARLAAFFGHGLGPGRLTALVVLALAFVYGSLGLHQVQEGERCLVLRNGRLLGVQEPGLHWNPPVLDTWRSVNVERLREATLSTEVISQDEDLVAITLTLRYRVTDPRAYLLGFADAEAEMLRVAEAALQQAAARQPVAALAGPAQRGLVAQLQDAVGAHLADLGTGLTLAGASLASVTTPAEIGAAVTAVDRARADIALQVQKAREEGQQGLRQSRQEAARRVAEAERGRTAALQQAQGDAQRLGAAIDAAAADPGAARRALYEEAVADVLARTPTVIVGEAGLARLGIAPEKLRAASPLPPPPAGRARP